MITKLIGTRIKELRAKLGVSQETFANKIGMARTYFAEVETGKRNVSIRNLGKITSGLNVTLAEFFDSDIFNALYRPFEDAHDHTSKGAAPYSLVALPPSSPSDENGQHDKS